MKIRKWLLEHTDGSNAMSLAEHTNHRKKKVEANYVEEITTCDKKIKLKEFVVEEKMETYKGF